MCMKAEHFTQRSLSLALHAGEHGTPPPIC